MFETILVGTDGSEPAQRAVQAAGELATGAGLDTIHVVAGYHPISSSELAHLAAEIPQEFLDSLSSDAPGVNVLDDATRALERMGLEVDGHAVPENGADAILDVAEELGADLIVVGARGHGIGHRLLRGSVSTKVVHHAPCSVLIVHDD